MFYYYMYDNTGNIRTGTAQAKEFVIVPDGWTLVELQSGQPAPDVLLHKIDISTGSIVSRTQDNFPQLKSEKIQELQRRCKTKIYAGFTSSALGEPYTYGSNETDQLNMLHGGDIMCADQQGVWALRNHNEQQAATLRADFVAFRDAQRTKLAGLLAQLKNATTKEDIDAIKW